MCIRDRNIRSVRDELERLKNEKETVSQSLLEESGAVDKKEADILEMCIRDSRRRRERRMADAELKRADSSS